MSLLFSVRAPCQIAYRFDAKEFHAFLGKIMMFRFTIRCSLCYNEGVPPSMA